MRRLIFISSNRRPASFPFLSGDGFRSISDHIYINGFNPGSIKIGETLFVEMNMLSDFFNNCHKFIKNRYILISHNGDETIDYKMAQYVDDKIIIWFSQNVDVLHPKIIPLPIGLENYYFYNFGIPSIFIKLRKLLYDKKNRILYGFNLKTNLRERKSAYDCLCLSSVADRIKGKINPRLYLKLLSGYKFVASPPGNGIDCIRTWEAMYLGVVPIVKRSVLTEYFYSMGLPLFIIDDWSELDTINEASMASKYESFKDGFNHQALFMDYWIKRIINVKKLI